ncbi:MAG: hypothetical protein ACE1Y2_06715, partial [Stenotrophomonas maltophilia]
LGFFIGAVLFFYRGGYEPPPQAQIAFDEIQRNSASPGSFVDRPARPPRDGVLLVDAAHRNSFRPAEVVSFLNRIGPRGYEIKYLGDFSSGDASSRTAQLEEGLRGADSFLVILPRDSYSSQEASLVEKFADKGGEVLLIGDPTRRHDINSLAGRFGLDFQPDYLYNIHENDLNFKNIYVRDFQPDQLTQGLKEIVLYTAGSVKSTGPGLAFTDNSNTRSSITDQIEQFQPLVWGNRNNVLALYDLTFMIPPQDSILDNGQLISNLADFLTTGTRDFELSDFPNYLDGEVDILVEQPSLFSLGVDLKNRLSVAGVGATLRGVEDIARDTIILGLYADSPRAARYLAESGIQLGEDLNTPFTSNIELEGTALILLGRNQDRDALVILADSTESLKDAVKQLTSGDFRTGLVDDFVGVYKTE